MGRGAALPDPTTMESASGKQEADAFFFSPSTRINNLLAAHQELDSSPGESTTWKGF